MTLHFLRLCSVVRRRIVTKSEVNMASIGSKTFHYFAFGSNLLKERITINNPTAAFQTIARLEGYKLVFCDTILTDWHGGAASIERDVDREVWGAVWTLGLADLPHLDRQEQGYRRLTVAVESMEGRTIQCETYQFAGSPAKKAPSRYYKDVIVRGARQHNLPRHYLQLLEDVQHNQFEGHVPVYDLIMQRIESAKRGDDDR